MPDRRQAIACDDKGLAVFDLLRRGRTRADALLCAFDLLELDGEDLRCADRGAQGCAGEASAPTWCRQACALGCEGIVSKRLGSRYGPGRARCWVKVKNPEAPAVRRLEEEDWKW